MNVTLLLVAELFETFLVNAITPAPPLDAADIFNAVVEPAVYGNGAIAQPKVTTPPQNDPFTGIPTSA
jgi:hypothetical protein